LIISTGGFLFWNRIAMGVRSEIRTSVTSKREGVGKKGQGSSPVLHRVLVRNKIDLANEK